MDRSSVIQNRLAARAEGGAVVGLQANEKLSTLAVGILFFAPIGYGFWLAAKGKMLLGLGVAVVGPFASLWAAGKIVEAVDS